ncbi:MAG: hypothetical protein GY750_06960 [Lentisphaerae bacterium]|nr:hypothetical protein [Lentisphaerota bacterium]MCP4101150.1 hypothetical protein [Lentisphaerota bacterium]
MVFENNFLAVDVSGDKLFISSKASDNNKFELAWPGCEISFEGKMVIPQFPVSPFELHDKFVRQTFSESGLLFEIKLEFTDSFWMRKSVKVSKTGEMPVPDYMDADIQCFDGEIEVCGYMPEIQKKQKDVVISEDKGEEEESGKIPGCGYPLMGKHFFSGLEHPAAYNDKTENGWRLRHFPQWEGDSLECVSSVFGICEDPYEGFMEYLQTIRLPRQKEFMVSFCTFWSDPYIGNYEYDVHYDNYVGFFKAFEKLQLKPDVFTLDAGWNDRQSIFQAKPEVGGDDGLEKIRNILKEQDIDLSLWISHNGPMGISKEFLEQQNHAVGGGQSAAYCVGDYGVMMDPSFENALGDRFKQLAADFDVRHYKIDWDNECATNDSFTEKYPTKNHVRQGSLNAMIRIAETIREAAPWIVTRNGWWPSPWWLCHANHVWLTQSGDSEYSAVPSKNQRDSSSTHRDVMYYNLLQRDKSPVPLEGFDNYEFPDALRNPFDVDSVSWVNAAWLVYLRGSSYVALTLQPESLEDWQVASLKSITEFCRVHASDIIVDSGRMIGGHPGKGEIYGFLQPGKSSSWCLLRNPLPVPQRIKLDANELDLLHNVDSKIQFYPNYEAISQNAEITIPAHGIVIFVADSKPQQLISDLPFMVEKCGDKFAYRYPARISVSENVRPLVEDIYQIPDLKVEEVKKQVDDNKFTLTFKVTSPYRMREFELQVAAKNSVSKVDNVELLTSRYSGAIQCCFSQPVTFSKVGPCGHGEEKNIDGICDSEIQFFSTPVPAGGETYCRLILSGENINSNDLELWLSGYEAPSREAVVKQSAPLGFDDCLPYQHPLGFPLSTRIEV